MTEMIKKKQNPFCCKFHAMLSERLYAVVAYSQHRFTSFILARSQRKVEEICLLTWPCTSVPR